MIECVERSASNVQQWPPGAIHDLPLKHPNTSPSPWVTVRLTCSQSTHPWLQEPFVEFIPNSEALQYPEDLGVASQHTQHYWGGGNHQADTHLCISSCLNKPLSEVLLLHLCSRTPRTAMFIHLLIGKHRLVHRVPVNQGLLKFIEQNDAVWWAYGIGSPWGSLHVCKSTRAGSLPWDLRASPWEDHRARKPPACCWTTTKIKPRIHELPPCFHLWAGLGGSPWAHA